jgi:amino acid transporter
MSTKAARKLKPSLGLIDATAISVGAIIGAGIYVVTGIVASLYTLPVIPVGPGIEDVSTYSS